MLHAGLALAMIRACCAQVGNKSFGLEALMKYLGLTPSGVRTPLALGETLSSARSHAPSILQWVGAGELGCQRHGCLHAGAARGRPVHGKRQRCDHTRLLLNPVGGEP